MFEDIIEVLAKNPDMTTRSVDSLIERIGEITILKDLLVRHGTTTQKRHGKVLFFKFFFKDKHLCRLNFIFPIEKSGMLFKLWRINPKAPISTKDLMTAKHWKLYKMMKELGEKIIEKKSEHYEGCVYPIVEKRLDGSIVFSTYRLQKIVCPR
jgi:hypothetical protein